MPEMKPESDFGGYEELAAGQYHFVILESQINPPKRNGDGVLDGFNLKLQVRNGRTAGAKDGEKCSEIGKVFTDGLAFPSESHKDQGRFCRQRITNLLIACGIITEEDRKADRMVAYYPGGEIEGRDDFRGKQFIGYIVTKPSKSANGREYQNPELDSVHVYHVHNPKVAHVPKDLAAAKLIPVPAAYASGGATATAATTPATNGNGNGSQQQSQQKQPETVGAGAGASGGIDLSSL